MGMWRRLLRNGLGSGVIVLVLGLLAVGLPALDRSLDSTQALPDGVPYEVGGGVTVIPPPGALLDVTKTRPSDDRGTVLFLVGPIRYAVVVQPFEGGLPDAADKLRRKIAANRGYQVVGREASIATADGQLLGLSGGYSAPGRGGRYAVFLAGDRSIEVTVSGTDPQLSAARAAIDASTRSITVRGTE
ncbi:hypothetical protein JCM9533A_53650 [Catenuloplanes niger JCM 9533]|uniref:Uncharacterized protein n=2 Tax=Micromonosporaceae TaxID=28056 RepID=A0AAE3ZRM8_9ACTN|nr:hypothetical protein [Catenuloplanes niger]